MNFLEAFRKKTRVDPGADFDHKFWAKFDAEFKAKTTPAADVSWWEEIQEWFKLHPVPAGLALAGVALIAVAVVRPRFESPTEAQPMFAQMELLQDLEMLEELGDTGDITDEEWGALLDETEAG
jgi:hypothetical protein